MKKKILILICLPFFYFASAQNVSKCLTCKDGMHDGMNDKSSPDTLSSPHRLVGHQYGNGNSSFGQSYIVQNLCGLNYVMNGVQTTTRYSVPGTGFPMTLPMAGLPAGFIVQQAYVYYGVSYTEATPPTTSVDITNPALVNNTITSVLAGQGHPVCWGERGTATYRCDITTMISGNGNYGINILGFVNAASEVDGLSIIIVYVDPAATYSGNIVLWDGDMADWTGTSMTYTGNGFTACTASSSGSAFSLQGDCQNNIFPNTNTNSYNGSVGTFPNNFWNTNVVATNVSACQNTAVYNGYTNNTNDCWLWSMVGLYWQYSNCNACSSMTVTDTAINPSCGNNSGSININVSGGTSPYTYTWTPNVSTSASATGLSAGTYQITIQDAGCNVKTLSITLTMVNLIISDSVTNILCNGETNGTASFNVSGGRSPYTYSWTPNVSSSASANGLSAGTYTVIIDDITGCQNTRVVTITQPAPLSLPITPTGALCNGMSDGQATVSVTGGTSPYKYSWSSGQTTTIASGLSAGSYTLNVTDVRGCTASATTSITQPSQLDVSLSGPAIVCRGSQGTLTSNASGGTSPYQYTWIGQNINPSNTYTATINAATQTDTVKITDANGCTATAQITVNLGPDMTVSILGPPSICYGLSTTLCADIQGGTGGNTYAWQSPINAITPCVTVSPTATTTYSLNVFDNCGTESSATFTLRVNPLPDVAFTSSLFEGCTPLCVQFYNTTTLAQGKAATYLWTFGDKDSSNIASPIHCYSNNGNYDVGVTVTSDSGCSSTLKKTGMITAFSRPNGAFIYSPQSVSIIDPTVQFTDMSTDPYNIIYWKWNFGDRSDSVSHLENPTYTYQDTGSYCVTMATMDVHGCTDTVTNCLIVEPAFNLYIPSAFTPNGDSKNPTFEPKGDYIKSFEMYIFDRWGMQIYHTKDITQGWDGTVGGGSVAQEDTYIYKIIVTDSEKKQHTYIGNVTLLR